MSADEKQSGYITAVLEQQGAMLVEVRDDIKSLNTKVDATAVQLVAMSAQAGVTRDELRRTACPKAGLCLELQDEVNALKKVVAELSADRQAAYSTWKVLTTLCGALVILAGFIWTVLEIIKNFAHK